MRMAFLALVFLAVWSGMSIMLPLARVCGFVDWSWWICAAPAVAWFLSSVVLSAWIGLLAAMEKSSWNAGTGPDDVTEEDIREVEAQLRDLLKTNRARQNL